MTLLAFKNLRRDIVRGAANCALALSVELKLGRQTKITYFDLHLVIEEQVTEFEITMDHTMRMQVLDCSTDLIYIALHFELV